MAEQQPDRKHLRLFRSKKLNPEHVAAINRAIRHNVKGKEHNVLIEYTKADGTKTDRKIRPLAVRGKHLLLAHDHNRGEVRSFRMDRVGMVKAAFWVGFEKVATESSQHDSSTRRVPWKSVGAGVLGAGVAAGSYFLGRKHGKGLARVVEKIKEVPIEKTIHVPNPQHLHDLKETHRFVGDSLSRLDLFDRMAIHHHRAVEAGHASADIAKGELSKVLAAQKDLYHALRDTPHKEKIQALGSYAEAAHKHIEHAHRHTAPIEQGASSALNQSKILLRTIADELHTKYIKK